MYIYIIKNKYLEAHHGMGNQMSIYTNSVQSSFANSGLNSDLFTLVVCIATICIYTVYGMGNQMSTGYCHKSHVNNLGSMFLNHCLCFPRGSITSQ